tara:strand:+ start:1031 stop:1210 length:180 start_codon:yes stop_codon:yes gene_type:complete
MGMSLLEKLSPYMYDEKAVEEITNKHFDDLEIEELQRKEEIPVAFNEYHTNHTHLGGAE